jgi:glucokinase
LTRPATTAIGLDLGGSSLRGVLVDRSGRILERRSAAWAPDATRERLLADVMASIHGLQRSGDATICGVGIGAAGVLAADGTLMPGMTNLPQLAGVPIAGHVSRELGLRCHLLNDSDAATLGEVRFGAARGCRFVLCATIGTGIGAGLWLDGTLLRGAHNAAGELGLMRVRGAPASAGGGDWRMLEDLAAPGRIARTTGQSMEKLFAARREGDAAAATLLADVADLLGAAIASAVHLLDLDRVVLAGGVVAAEPSFSEEVAGAARRHRAPGYPGDVPVVPALLGPWSGAVGAACQPLDGAPTA